MHTEDRVHLKTGGIDRLQLCLVRAASSRIRVTCNTSEMGFQVSSHTVWGKLIIYSVNYSIYLNGILTPRNNQRHICALLKEYLQHCEMSIEEKTFLHDGIQKRHKA